MNIDVAAQIGATFRRVADRDHEGRPARVVVAERDYETDIADLWDAVTNPERLPRWFLPVTGDLKLGGRYQLQGNAGGAITRCDRPSALDVTWEFGGGVSWVNLRLTEAAPGKTHLQLEHIAHVEEHWEKFGPGAVGVGWELSLLGLSLHIASSGAQVDPAAFEAWTTGDNGKDFVRRSAAGWGEADIAGGEDADAARERAARTAAFYTGEAAP